MNVSLTPELEQYVNGKVQSGMYHSASEVIREGLRLLKEREELHHRSFGPPSRDSSRHQSGRPGAGTPV